MAQSGFGEILKWGVIIGGGYYLYNLLTANSQVAAVPAPVGSTPVTTPQLVAALAATPSAAPASGGTSAVLTSADLATQLTAAASAAGAGANPMLTADQWDYYRNMAYPPALTPQQFGSAFPSPTSPMSAQDFVAALSKVGLAGLGGLGGPRRRIPLPVRTPQGFELRWV